MVPLVLLAFPVMRVPLRGLEENLVLQLGQLDECVLAVGGAGLGLLGKLPF